MSFVLLIPYYAGGLLFWPIFRVFSRAPSPHSQRLRRIFWITLLALGGLAGTIAALGGHERWRSGLFPLINLASVLFSIGVFLGNGEAPLTFLQKPHLAAATSVGFVVTALMFFGGFTKVDILLHDARTTATVVGTGAHGVLKYQYEVGGRTYTGGGDPGHPPYPHGSTYEIRYSSARPYFSTAENPWTFFGRMLVGSLFVGCGAFCISRTAARRRSAAASQTHRRQDAKENAA